MRVKELRISNWVSYAGKEGKVWEVRQFVSTLYYRTMLSNPIGNTHLEPIPLTEEWLVRFDFKPGLKTGLKSKDSHGKTYDAIRTYSKGDFVLEKCGENQYRLVGHGKIVEYVHRLQNLYYELEDKEL